VPTDLLTERRREIRALLVALGTGAQTLNMLCREQPIPYWERAYLARILPWLRRQARRLRSGFARSSELRASARKLLSLRCMAEETNPGRWYLDQRGFKGNPRHLDLLLHALGAPISFNEWNAWRRRASRVRPDLRGATLWGLSLKQLHLHRARLDHAYLGGASLRNTNASGASFVGARLAETDLSYADLRGADFRTADLRGAVFTDADLSRANLRGTILAGCVLNRTKLHGADLRGALVWGTSVWDAHVGRSTRQEGLLIGWDDLDPIDVDEAALRAPSKSLAVDDIRVAHFMSLVRSNAELADVLDAASSRMVLLLGRFTDGQEEVLEALKEALPQLGYAPVVFNFHEPKNRDLIETVSVLAGMALCVIADLSQPRSVPLESHLTIPQIAIPWVPIIRAGEQPFSMFGALQRKYPWVLPTVKYRTAASLARHLKEWIIEPAKAKSRELRAMKHGRGGPRMG
jgi:uncharacterized protein YjbI with pentapeptide repeats